ncbi:hypothetical protein GGR52DRAFT_216180 [Hypoxylon sp. FL1284]|nr:hypothetical protein GGR52DRAFT_216180 [Hypoxylon sp. FL1284]
MPPKLMLRKLWQIGAGARGSSAAPILAQSSFQSASSLLIRTQPQRQQSRQSSFFTGTHKNDDKVKLFPGTGGGRRRSEGGGRGSYYYDGGRRRAHARTLRAAASGIYGTIFMSIVMLVADESMSYQSRQALALSSVYDIMQERDPDEKIRRYWATGRAALEAYAAAGGPDDVVVCGAVRPDPRAGWADDEIDAVVMTAPDPEWPGGTLVFCQAVLFDMEPDAIYVAEHGNRATDAAEALLVTVEEFARDLGGPVRGGLLIMQPSGDWKSLYFDGKRWINVVYLEWQTAASMGLE